MSDWFAPVVRSVIAPAWALWERSPYLKHHRGLLRTQFDSPEAIRQRQWQRVKDLIDHAVTSTTFWRARFSALGIEPGDITTWEDFGRIGVLTKDDLRSQHGALLARGFDPQKLTHKKTSGSTGVKVEVLVDELAQQHKRACAMRANEWSGWRQGERVAMVWGNPEYLHRGWRGRLRNLLLERGNYLDTLKMDVPELARYHGSLKRRPPSLILGHAHSLYLLASYMEGAGGAGFRPRGIISTAMVLHPFERRTIERVWGTEVTDRYGCEEVSLIASQCEAHQDLHLNSDGVLVEIVRPDGAPAAAGEAGTVLVTDLHNRAMPILRYQVGDMAVPTDRQCPCGRGLPLLERIEGRVADYVLTPEGDFISGISLTENFAMLVPGVAQLQIVQEELDDIRFRIVRGPEFTTDGEGRLLQLARRRFGDRVRFQCEYVENIPQEPSGKYRFCISKVANPYSQPREVAVS